MDEMFLLPHLCLTCLRVCAWLCCCWPSSRKPCQHCPSPSPLASSSTSPQASWFSPSWTTWLLISSTSEAEPRPPLTSLLTSSSFLPLYYYPSSLTYSSPCSLLLYEDYFLHCFLCSLGNVMREPDLGRKLRRGLPGCSCSGVFLEQDLLLTKESWSSLCVVSLRWSFWIWI